ncbi:MAG: group III truncated hemoglobin [Verrucomicrobiales bacterium]
MTDIRNEVDIRTFVDAFYDDVQKDDLLGPVFNDVAQVNWAEHLPLLYQFWNTLLFRTGSYKGQPLSKHLPLPVTKAHFDRWLSLFCRTIDTHFQGPKAEEAKNFARSIADTFQLRMGLLDLNFLSKPGAKPGSVSIPITIQKRSDS